MFMRTVQQNMFLVLNRVPVTFVTDSELISTIYASGVRGHSEFERKLGEGLKLHLANQKGKRPRKS